jgi:hypothetical protein
MAKADERCAVWWSLNAIGMKGNEDCRGSAGETPGLRQNGGLLKRVETTFSLRPRDFSFEMKGAWQAGEVNCSQVFSTVATGIVYGFELVGDVQGLVRRDLAIDDIKSLTHLNVSQGIVLVHQVNKQALCWRKLIQ